jgi:hypothetical protein
MKKRIWMLLLVGSSLIVQACGSVRETDPDKDAAHKRANRENYAEEAQSSQ